MNDILHTQLVEQKVKKTIPIDLNVFMMQTLNQEVNEKIVKLHKEMFKDQTEDAVVGYLNVFDPQTVIQQLPLKLQQMEYKKINNTIREQVLLILYYTGTKQQNNEPITLVRGAKNQYGAQKIDMLEMDSKRQTVNTTFDRVKAADEYKKRTSTGADPFKSVETVEDEEINRLYYLCLRECQARMLKCILLCVNKVNEKIMTDGKIATRIFQILTRWIDIEELEEKRKEEKILVKEVN